MRESFRNVVSLTSLLGLVACGKVSPVDSTDGRAGDAGPDGGADGSDGGSVDCRGLDETHCRAQPACAVGSCANCGGGSVFAACYRPGVDSPPPCPGLACPVGCALLDEATCKLRTDCRADYCAACQGSSFLRCAAPSDPPAVCPAVSCVITCAQVTALDQCEARSDCHSVFVDPGTCGCASPGCCARFSRCADGDRARCSGVAACTSQAPHCEGSYVVAYTATCYEGCVQMKDCAP